MATFGAANTSTTSTEEFRQKMAEVERMLREMKQRSLGGQEELARREHKEAQKCECGLAAQGRAVLALLGLVIGSLNKSPSVSSYPSPHERALLFRIIGLQVGVLLHREPFRHGWAFF